MSRLDRHVAAVQNKLTINQFLELLARIGIGVAAAAWLAILIDRLIGFHLPRQILWLDGLCAAAGVVAAAWALWLRPSRHFAAAAIDEKLQLKEKFSTALYVQSDPNPFAQAVVRDAHATADIVSLAKKFPLVFPRPAAWTIAVAVGALLTAWLMPSLDLLGHAAHQRQLAQRRIEIVKAQQAVDRAWATVSSVPSNMASAEGVGMAKDELAPLVNQSIKDPAAAQRSALKALQDVTEAYKQEIKKNEQFATAQNSSMLLRAMSPPMDNAGPVGQAHRDLIKGNFSGAADNLEKAIHQFANLSPQKQQQMMQQMQNLAQQLSSAANSAQAQQQLQQQLQQMGANQQQAQQLAQAMQQAANGNPAGQQQIQNMAKQLAQQMNNGKGANQQQMQQMQQMMQQMQAGATAQAQTQQLAQAAQQLAQAMQQSGQGAQAGQSSGNAMQSIQQQMQQQLAQMDAIAQDARQAAAGAEQAQQAADQTANNMSHSGGKAPSGSNNGQWASGQPNPVQGGTGGPGRGGGQNEAGQEVPFGVKAVLDSSRDIEGGKILASTFVKADSVRGEAKAQLKEAAVAAEQDATDEVDEDRIARPVQEVVKKYYDEVKKDAE